jgi:hypothetical protein
MPYSSSSAVAKSIYCPESSPSCARETFYKPQLPLADPYLHHQDHLRWQNSPPLSLLLLLLLPPLAQLLAVLSPPLASSAMLPRCCVLFVSYFYAQQCSLDISILSHRAVEYQRLLKLDDLVL